MLRPAPQPPASTRQRARLGWGLAAGVALLLLAVLASLALGGKPIAPATVVRDLIHPNGSDDGLIITGLRLPRTLLGLAVGGALGLAGVLMQAVTRNPLADPGVLGVNAGAAAAVVTAIAVLHLGSQASLTWFALLGAGIAATLKANVKSTALADSASAQNALSARGTKIRGGTNAHVANARFISTAELSRVV